jgi:hypothetical protein
MQIFIFLKKRHVIYMIIEFNIHSMRYSHINRSYVYIQDTVNKASRVSRPQPGCHYQLSLGGNNDVILQPRKSLVETSRLGTGNSRRFFTVYIYMRIIYLYIFPSSLKTLKDKKPVLKSHWQRCTLVCLSSHEIAWL